jgi:hypothetical protein
LYAVELRFAWVKHTCDRGWRWPTLRFFLLSGNLYWTKKLVFCCAYLTLPSPFFFLYILMFSCQHLQCQELCAKLFRQLCEGVSAKNGNRLGYWKRRVLQSGFMIQGDCHDGLQYFFGPGTPWNFIERDQPGMLSAPRDPTTKMDVSY